MMLNLTSRKIIGFKPKFYIYRKYLIRLLGVLVNSFDIDLLRV